MSCQICAENYNLNVRYCVKCPSCEFDACKACVRKFILSNQVAPKCMNCNSLFQTKFLVDNLNRSWVMDQFKTHHVQTMLNEQLSKMPETIPFAEAERERRRLTNQNVEYANKIHAYSEKIRKYNRAIAANRYLMRGEDIPPNLRNDLNDGVPVIADTKKKFIMACPSESCKGFLSTAYKCSLCDKFTCCDCMNVLGTARDPTHVCKESDKLSAELIKKETKPCPTCGERIFKIDGCDQMFCTGCHTAFSWITGKIELGTIHNPHFYELRRQQGAVLRNVGDVQCGGIPDFHEISQIFHYVASTVSVEVRKQLGFSALHNKLKHIHRMMCEITAYTINIHRQKIREYSETIDLRVKYLMDDLSKEQLAETTYYRDRERQKHTEMNHILELISISGIETFIDMGNVVAHDPLACIDAFKTKLDMLQRIRLYCNEQLKEISITYKCRIYEYDELFNPIPKRFTIHGNEAK